MLPAPLRKAVPSDSGALLLADDSLPGLGLLLSGLSPAITVWRVSRRADAAPILRRAFASGYGAVHLLGHGRPGGIRLGGGFLGEQDFLDASFGPGGAHGPAVLRFWSCCTGAGRAGRSFVERLSERLSCSVGAFSGLAGSMHRGGSWHPDVFAGSAAPASASVPFPNAASYPYTLQDEVLELALEETAGGIDLGVWLKAGIEIDSLDLSFSFSSQTASFSGADLLLSGWTGQTGLPDPASPGSLLLAAFVSTAPFPPFVDASNDTLIASLHFTVPTETTGRFSASLDPASLLDNSTLDHSDIPLGAMPQASIELGVGSVDFSVAVTSWSMGRTIAGVAFGDGVVSGPEGLATLSGRPDGTIAMRSVPGLVLSASIGPTSPGHR